ncbi:MAG TPA: hypothetical protein VIR01_17435, partial [Pyrinomonadaceae bacterium]
MKRRTRHACGLMISCAFFVMTWTANAQQQPPDLFSYNELVQLYEQETPPEALQNKLRLLLTTPFVNNQASARGTKPVLPVTPNL